MKLESDRRDISFLEDIVNELCEEYGYKKEVVYDFYDVLIKYLWHLWDSPGNLAIRLYNLGTFTCRKPLVRRPSNEVYKNKFPRLAEFRERNIKLRRKNVHQRKPMVYYAKNMEIQEEFQNKKYKKFTGED